MQTLGERLEEARKRKGISIREAAEATKIRGDYLQKFEANTFDFDLPPLYVRGFLRTYVRFLELDAQRLVAEFDSLAADAGRAPRRESRENFGRVDFGGGSGESAESSGGSSGGGIDPVTLKYALFGGGVVVLVLIIWLVISLFTGGDSKPAKQRAEAPAQTTQQAANGPVQPENLGTAQTLVFTAIDATRVKIVRDVDKSVVYDGKLERGESRTFQKAGKFLVTVEKGANLRMEVNGRSYPVPLEGYGRFALD